MTDTNLFPHGPSSPTSATKSAQSGHFEAEFQCPLLGGGAHLLILQEFSTFHLGYPHAYPLVELVAPAAFQRRSLMIRAFGAHCQDSNYLALAYQVEGSAVVVHPLYELCTCVFRAVVCTINETLVPVLVYGHWSGLRVITFCMGLAAENAQCWAALVRDSGPPDYERFLSDAYTRFLRPGNVVLDVGAHVGGHAVNFVQLCGQNGHVICFEPLPEFADRLRQRFVGCPHVEVRQCALASSIGESEFVFAQNYPAYSGLKERIYDGDDPQTRLITVPISTVDLEVDTLGLKRVDYIKMDIEGGEVDCLHGAALTLQKQRPVVSVEYGKDSYLAYGHGPETIYEVMANHEYVMADLWGNLIPDRNEWLSVVDGPYWDYFAVPRERSKRWSQIVKGNKLYAGLFSFLSMLGYRP